MAGKERAESGSLRFVDWQKEWLRVLGYKEMDWREVGKMADQLRELRQNDLAVKFLFSLQDWPDWEKTTFRLAVMQGWAALDPADFHSEEERLKVCHFEEAIRLMNKENEPEYGIRNWAAIAVARYTKDESVYGTGTYQEKARQELKRCGLSSLGKG